MVVRSLKGRAKFVKNISERDLDKPCILMDFYQNA